MAAELFAPVPAELLAPAEWQSIRDCEPPRIADFTAGRLCARRALARLGIVGYSLLPGADRQPIWPAGIVGSITHAEGHAAAVVARAGQLAALGLDSVLVAAVPPRLWPAICTPAELESLRDLAPEAQAQRAAVTFAAKEAFFKCQYPITHQWLGFKAVAIAVAEASSEIGTFRVVPVQELQLLSQRGRDARQVLAGRWHRQTDHVVAGMALPARGTQ